MESIFPFGSTSKMAEQDDKAPKKVFVLSDYANAIHAEWIDVDGNVKVKALPIASETSFFCSKEDADQIIRSIQIPAELGKLIPVEEHKKLSFIKGFDMQYLFPSGFERKDVWFCHMIPYPLLNPKELNAINSDYDPLVETHNLPKCTIPIFDPSGFNSESRHKEILAELEQSQADTIILLGDLPIKHFLAHFSKYTRLADFEKGFDDLERLVKYGERHKMEIAGKLYDVIPLVHPRELEKVKDNMSRKNHIYWHMKGSIINFYKIRYGKEPSQVAKKPAICPICREKEIATYVFKEPPFSEHLEQKIRDGKVILKDSPIAEDEPKYVCLECRFEFYKTKD